MLGVFTSWDWTEVIEGGAVTALFASVPILLHHLAAKRRHREVMEAHRKTHEHLGVE